jgi:hypothetical protein
MLKFLTGIKGTLIKYGAILFGLFSLFFYGYTKGRTEAENEQTQREKEAMRDEIKASVATSRQIENQQSQTIVAEEKHATERKEAVEKVKESKTYDFRKWVVVLFFTPWLLSCASREVTIYKTVVPPLPVQKKYERPEYAGAPFRVNAGQVCMTEPEISALFGFVSRLKESVKNYESQVDATNRYFDELRGIYK